MLLTLSVNTNFSLYAIQKFFRKQKGTKLISWLFRYCRIQVFKRIAQLSFNALARIIARELSGRAYSLPSRLKEQIMSDQTVWEIKYSIFQWMKKWWLWKLKERSIRSPSFLMKGWKEWLWTCSDTGSQNISKAGRKSLLKWQKGYVFF